MSLWKRVAKFAAVEIAKTGLAAVGQHIGDAVGQVIGQRIDKNHGKTLGEADDVKKPEDKKDATP